VEHIHLHRGHAVEVAQDDIQRDKVPPGVDHQSTPGISRRVVDVHRRQHKPRTLRLHQLQQRFEAMHRAEDGLRLQGRAGACHIQRVAFIGVQR
jgi:hypothetical protein